MTTSTIPTATKGKENVRHGPSSLCPAQWDRPKRRGKLHSELVPTRSLGKTLHTLPLINPLVCTKSGSRLPPFAPPVGTDRYLFSPLVQSIEVPSLVQSTWDEPMFLQRGLHLSSLLPLLCLLVVSLIGLFRLCRTRYRVNGGVGAFFSTVSICLLCSHSFSLYLSVSSGSVASD